MQSDEELWAEFTRARPGNQDLYRPKCQRFYCCSIREEFDTFKAQRLAAQPEPPVEGSDIPGLEIAREFIQERDSRLGLR